MLLVTARGRALVTFGGVTASLTAFALFGAAEAGMVALATLWLAASGPSVVGMATIAGDLGCVDPHEVRRYREDHPGTTISEAVAVVARR